MSMSSISSLVLTSEISSITFVMVEGSGNNENRETGCDMLMRCSMGFSGYGSHLNGDILIGKYRSNTIYIFCQDGMNNPLCLENSFGNLDRVFSVFNEEKILENIGGEGEHFISESKKY